MWDLWQTIGFTCQNQPLCSGPTPGPGHPNDLSPQLALKCGRLDTLVGPGAGGGGICAWGHAGRV
jgi:hypothetical protein